MATPIDSEAAEDDESPKRGRAGTPVEPARVLKAVRRGRWWLLAAAAIGVVAGVSIAKLAIEHTYESSASMRFEGVVTLDDEAASRPQDARRDLPSRLESLRRDTVLREVRERMGLSAVPIDVMQNLFSNTQDAESGLVTITGTGGTPERAAAMANTIVEVFVEHERDRRRDEITGAIGSLDGRIPAAQAELSLTRSRYDGFRREHGVTDLTTEQEAALIQATELRAEADLARADISSLEARVQQLREEVRRMPRMEVVSSSSSSVDEEELARSRAHLQQLRGTLSSEHPRVQVAERQVRSLEERTAGGATRVTGSVSMGASATHETAATALATSSADLEAARQRSIELQRLATEAQARVTAFSAIEGEAAALLADVQVKETLLNQLRNNRARLENMLENPDPGFRTIARAVEPESAVPSKRKYYVAGGIPLALIVLTLFALLYRELRGLRLQTAAEVAWWGNGPVVGTTTWPRDPKGAGDLVADLDDYVPEATGTMLIVGATEHETAIASELAKQLSSDWMITEMHGRDTSPDASRSLLPAMASASSGSASVLTSAEFEAAPTQVQRGAIELLGPPTIVSAGAPYGVLHPTPLPTSGPRLIASAWEGPLNGQQLRRAARLADRVLVVVPAGSMAAPRLRDVITRLGRAEGVGYVVVSVADEYASLPDRAGDIDEFWAATKE